MPSGLRLMLYAQHLSGVGHYVRTYELARELACRHSVILLEGGRPVPREPADGVQRIRLAGIVRGSDGLRPLEPGADLASVWRCRAAELQTAVSEVRPDAVLIEHYPFSKWELEEEIAVLLHAALRANPAVKVICSLRDVPLQTRHEACAAAIYARRVLDRLHRDFDAVMVHGDPLVTPLSAAFPQAGSLQLPVVHTGIVSQPLRHDPATQARISGFRGSSRLVVASAGGGEDRTKLLERCVRAWQSPTVQQALPVPRLALFLGLDCTEQYAARLREDARQIGALVLPFCVEYPQWMQAAAVSVSCAGYNTCANILETGVSAVLVPDPRMSDQARRAACMQELGLAAVVPAEADDAESLALAVGRALVRPRTKHAVCLDGATVSRRFIETLVGR